MPFYWNEHPIYDLDQDGEGGTDRRTEFLAYVLEMGDIFDINIYSDILRINRFVLGMETKFNFYWHTMYPFTPSASTTFIFRWEFGIILSW